MSIGQPEWVEEAERRAGCHAAALKKSPLFENDDMKDLIQDFLTHLVGSMDSYKGKALPTTYDQ